MNMIYEFYHGHTIWVLDLGDVILVQETMNDSLMRVTENDQYMDEIRWAVANTDRYLEEEAFYFAMSADAAYRLEKAINDLERLMDNDKVGKDHLRKEKDAIYTRFRRRRHLEIQAEEAAKLKK